MSEIWENLIGKICHIVCCMNTYESDAKMLPSKIFLGMVMDVTEDIILLRSYDIYHVINKACIIEIRMYDEENPENISKLRKKSCRDCIYSEDREYVRPNSGFFRKHKEIRYFCKIFKCEYNFACDLFRKERNNDG